MTPEFARDLARGDIPQDHRLVGAAGADLAVVIGAEETANEKEAVLFHPGGIELFDEELFCFSIYIIYLPTEGWTK